MERKQQGIGKDDALNRENEPVEVSVQTDSGMGKGEQMQKQDAADETPVSGETASADEVDRISKLEEALALKEAEAAANWDKYLRERADLENYRKRAQREKEDLLKYGNESLLLEILPVIDNMERALAHASDDTMSAVIEGVEMTLSLLVSTIRKFGVTPVEAKGKMFDPAYHQAMNKVETEDAAPNTVLDEFQKGYMLNDRLLRAALVSVAAAPKKVDA